MNWQFLIGHPVSSAAASNQSIHSIHPVHHHSRHHQVIHNDVVDDDEVLIIKFHSPFIISIYEPLSRNREDVRNLRLLQPKRQAKCPNQDILYYSRILNKHPRTFTLSGGLQPPKTSYQTPTHLFKKKSSIQDHFIIVQPIYHIHLLPNL